MSLLRYFKRDGSGLVDRVVGDDNPLPITTVPALALAGEDAYLVSTGKVSLSLAGHFRAVLKNPPTSGKLVVVTSLISYASINPANFAHVLTGVTVVPANDALVMNGMQKAAGDNNTLPGGITVKYDAVTGGSALDGTKRAEMRVEQGRTHHEAVQFILQPGVTIGINHEFTGAADAALSVVFYTKDL